MTADPSAHRTYVLGRPEKRGLLPGNRSNGESAVVIASGALGLFCAWVPGGLVGFVLLVGLTLLGFASVYVPVRGRTLYRWVPVDHRYRRQRRESQNRWRSAVREAGTRLDGKEVGIDPPPGVGDIKWLMVEDGGHILAVLLHLDTKAVTAAVEIEGPGVGLRDDQEALLDRWGVVLDNIANGEGFLDRISLVERCLPLDPDAHRRDVDLRGDRNCLPSLAGSYDQLQSLVSTSSERHRNYVVAHMSYSRALGKAARLHAKGDAGIAAVMAREIADLCARLEDADIRAVSRLDVAETSALVRNLYDPSWQIDRLGCQTPRTAWPFDLENQRDALAAHKGEWLHATAWVKAWPLVPVGVNFLAPLLVQMPGVVRTVAVTMDLVPTDRALDEALSAKTDDVAQSRRDERMGREIDPRLTGQAHRVDRRSEDLAAGAGGARVVGYVTVSARTPEQLDAAKRKTRSHAAKARLALEWCDREHDRAHVNTLPFARGLL